MKRTLTILVGTILLFVFACTKKPAVSPPPPQPPPHGGPGPNEKEVKVTVDTVNGICVIFDPGDVYLKRNQDKIKWCIEYKCSVRGVTIIIDDFKDQKSGPATSRNPFGDHSDKNNSFDFGPLDPLGSDCNKVGGTSSVSGRYYYRILVIGSDGKVLASQDPGVIIGD